MAKEKDQRSHPTGVLLVNTGTPASPSPHDVRAYLAKFLMDKRVAPMNRFAWWFILHLCILPRRGKASGKKYEQIWTPEGSPFVLDHEVLAEALEARLENAGAEVMVRFAMNYSKPTVRHVMREMKKAGCEHLVVLPLYPQSAYSTTLSVRDEVERARRRVHWHGTVDVIDNYAEHPSYIKALASSIRHAGFDHEAGDRLLFSYHSIPLSDIERGDTYELQTGSTSLHVADELGLPRTSWTIGYQCRFDKSRTWLSPFSKDVLARWAEVGGGRTFVVCPIFPIDCLETLYDVSGEFRRTYLAELAQAGHPSDESRFVYVRALGKSRAHVRVLADVVAPYLGDAVREEKGDA